MENPETRMKESIFMFPEDYGLPRGKSFIWYYGSLLKNEKFKKQCADGKFGIKGMLSKCVNSHGKWKSIANDGTAEDFIRDLVRKAKDICKDDNTWGNIPGELIEMLDELWGNSTLFILQDIAD
jgi:hypothetical protein